MVIKKLRQLSKMNQQINLYCSGKIGLGEFIGDLIFLREVILEEDFSWEIETQFNAHLLNLESVYSYVLEKNDGKLDSMIQPTVEREILELRKLLKVSESMLSRELTTSS